MTARALVIVDRDPRTDEAFAEALRMAIGLSLGVSEVRVILSVEAAVALARGPVPDEAVIRRHLAALEDMGIPVLSLADGGEAGDLGARKLETCSSERLDALVREGGAVLVW